ncbi:MAG: hypothetical protein LBC86_07060 [Oscillospiraceae bacterium]|jgi:hypothetical protein|nr:hypothetical protein [Oscillospiraceae bacterium]
MRKFYLIALIIIALTVTACGGVDLENLDLNKSFSFTAQLEYGGRSSAAHFTRSAPGEWSGTLTDPYALQGISIIYAPPEMSVSYSGFSADHSDTPSDINVTAFVMFCALESAFKGDGITVTSGKNFIEITGRTDGDTFILRLDKDGFPMMLDVPNRQLKIAFSEVTVRDF